MLGTNEDIYEDDDDDGAVPGPGAYWNPQTCSTFKVKSVPERLQFFGSTVERFNNKNPGISASANVLGPG